MSKKNAVSEVSDTPKPRRLDNDHDVFLRGLMAIKQLVIIQIKYILSKTLLPYVDWSSLKPVPETFVDTKLRYIASDCIYECDLLRSALPDDLRSKPDLPQMRFCFLMEGKSSAAKEPIDFQVEDYRKSIWVKDLKSKRFLGIVLPILIYNGEYAWNRKKVYDYFKSYLPPELLAMIPNLPLLLIDLHKLTDAEIAANVELGALRSAYLALKHGHDPEYFKRETKTLFKFAVDSDELMPKDLLSDFLKMLSEYIQRRSQMTETEIINIVLDSNNENMVAKVRTMFDVFEEKGIAIGEAKSEAKIKQAEAKIQEVEAKAKETEAKAKETEAKLRAIIKILMLTTPMTDAQFVQQFQLSEVFVSGIRKEIVV
jgi:hypothetical protein